LFLAALDKIPYVDFPELRINKYETTEMPFRYVKSKTGEPVMPEVCPFTFQSETKKHFANVTKGDGGTH
jgi:ribosome biogenesis SPOUT family RNA methylase Rps3